jgi:hypothetical protein
LNIHPANLICLAYSRSDQSLRQCIGAGINPVIHAFPLKFPCVAFVKVIAHYSNSAVASGKGNRVFTQKRHVQMASIATVPD